MERVIIRTLNPLQKTYFNATINYSANPGKDADPWHKKHAGQTVHITSDFEVYSAKEPKENKPAWSIRLDENRTSYFIQWDKDSKELIDRNKEIAIKHMMFHERMKPMFAQVNSNKRGEPLFSIEYEGMKNTFIADLNDKKFAVYKKYRTLSPEDKRDCAYYYQTNATNMKHSELIAKMIDMEKGVLMQQDRFVDGMLISDHFLTKYGTSDVTAAKLLAEKACTYAIIAKRDNGFYLDNDYIGTTMEMVYDYIKGNKQVQEMLKASVKNLDQSVEDDLKSSEKLTADFAPDDSHVLDIDELTELRKRAVELGVKDANKMKDMPRLRKEIADKERRDELRQKLFELTGKDPGKLQTSFLELEYKNALKNQESVGA